MGFVIAARHVQLGQLVAMKFLRCDGSDPVAEREASARFLREARAVVRLKNEHVARVFDVGELETGEPFIVMEYLDGADLAAIVKERGQIPASEAALYILHACEALAEAHSLGIVHRDVKLANLFVARDESGAPSLKVLDFGISKVNPFGEAVADMTQTSAMLGSPRFMSPEQMRDARTVDARSDVWSLGIVLYRLVSGRAPFEADTLGRLLQMVMFEEPPRLDVLVPSLPPGFDRVVAGCLMKHPQHRFANVAELAHALVPYAADTTRALAMAERVAATLKVQNPPRLDFSQTGTSSVRAPLMTSAIPQRRDSITAAPWTANDPNMPSSVRAPDPVPSSSKSSVAWGVAALVMMLALIGGAVKYKNARARSVAEASGATDAATTLPPPAPPPSTVTPAKHTPVPVLKLDDARAQQGPRPTSTGAPTGAPAVRQPATTTTTAPGLTAMPGTRRPAPTPTSTPRPANGGAHDDGIPTTRD